MEANRTTPFELGEWRVEPALNLLGRGEREVVLEPKVMDLLVFLARHAGETVSKEQLLEQVWGGAYVVEGVVFKTLSALREALDDDAREPRYVLTVRRRGYRLVAPVHWLEPSSDVTRPAPDQPSLPKPEASATSLSPPIRKLRSLAAAVLVLALAVLAFAGLARLRADRTTPPTATPIARLAVLAFEDLSGDRETAYLTRALHDEVVDRLARLGRPRVLLVPEAGEGGGDPLERARGAGAGAAVTARVAANGEQLRVHIRLVELRGAEVRWASTYERGRLEIEPLARQIVGDLARRVGEEPHATAPVAKSFRVDPLAYQAFLKARWLWSQRGARDLKPALAWFEEAVERDPSFAEGFAGLSLGLTTAGSYGVLEPRAAWARAKATAEHALELAPDLAAGHAALGHLRLVAEWDWQGAIAELEKAVALAPGPTPARQYLAEAYSVADRHDEALATIDDALALEPYSPLLLGVRALILNAAGRPEDVLRTLDEAEIFRPRFVWHHRYRAYALERLGRLVEAAEARARPQCLACAPGSLAERSHEAALGEGLSGFYRIELEIWALPENADHLGGPAQMAEALAALGRTEEVWPWLEKARLLKGEYFLHLRRSPAFDKLRDDPRWHALLDRAGLPRD